MVVDAIKRRSGTWQALYPAAIDLFYERGYEAATLRQLAAILGVQAGTLYNYVSGKQELLYTIVRTVNEQLIEESERLVRRHDDPVTRLRELVQHTVVFHALRTKEVFIGNYELRSLEPANRTEIMALRDRFEHIYQSVLRDGMGRGMFVETDVKVTSYALLTMCTGVSSWYRPRGRLDAPAIAALYADIAMHAVAEGARQ